MSTTSHGPRPGDHVGTDAGSYQAGTIPPSTQRRPQPVQPTVGELFNTMSQHLSTLVRDEIQLTKVQAIEKGKRLGVGAGLLAAAGVLALYVLGLLLLAAVWALGLVLPLWASFLIVAGVVLIVVLILALVGKKRIDASKEIDPNPQENLKADVDAVKKGIQQ